jgi:hypothetical protein
MQGVQYANRRDKQQISRVEQKQKEKQLGPADPAIGWVWSGSQAAGRVIKMGLDQDKGLCIKTWICISPTIIKQPKQMLPSVKQFV